MIVYQYIMIVVIVIDIRMIFHCINQQKLRVPGTVWVLTAIRQMAVSELWSPGPGEPQKNYSSTLNITVMFSGSESSKPDDCQGLCQFTVLGQWGFPEMELPNMDGL